MRPGQEVLDLGIDDEPGPGRAGVITGKRSAVLWQVLSAVYARLGFDVVGDEAFKQLVLARIVEPTSKADSLRVLGVVHGSLRTMFRCLGRAQERGYRDVVASACFEHASTSGDVSLCLYDVTTLYFEAEHEDELRKVGYSKERRVDPQIIVGLLVDRAGFPLEIGCWEGNKAETTTMLPIIRQFQDRHSIEAMVVVADAGMLSAGNLKDLHEAGLRFIVGSRATKWAYSAKRAARDAKTLTLQENRAKAVIAGEKAARTPRFVTVKNGSRSLDETSLARARRVVGLKGYVTNIPATVMPAGEVIASYHELWHVEASFRMSKSDLRARPIFHHTRDAIEAHLTIVFAALAVARYLQDATGMSIKKIVNTLRPLQQIQVRIAGHEHLAQDPLTPTAETILDALDLSAQ